MMLASLRLEAIGDNHARQLHGLARSLRRLGLTSSEKESLMPDVRRPWVARITGLDSRYGLAREFVRGTRDYSEANSVGSRGLYLYYALADGIYEVRELISWQRDRRYFVRSEAGDIIEISRDDVDAWLEAHG